MCRCVSTCTSGQSECYPAPKKENNATPPGYSHGREHHLPQGASNPAQVSTNIGLGVGRPKRRRNDCIQQRAIAYQLPRHTVGRYLGRSEVVSNYYVVAVEYSQTRQLKY